MSKKIILVGDGWGFHAVKDGAKGLLFGCIEDSTVKLENLDADILLFAGYKPIIPIGILKKFLCLNIHYSLLPKYRGFHPVAWGILNGDTTFGYTIHVMNERIDDGPIVHQEEITCTNEETMTQIMERLNARVSASIGVVIGEMNQSTIEFLVNDSNQATWFPKRDAKDNILSSNYSCEYFSRLKRILVGHYPSPIIRFNGVDYSVVNWDIEFSQIERINSYGKIVESYNEGIRIAVNGGYLLIRETKPDLPKLKNGVTLL